MDINVCVCLFYPLFSWRPAPFWCIARFCRAREREHLWCYEHMCKSACHEHLTPDFMHHAILAASSCGSCASPCTRRASISHTIFLPRCHELHEAMPPYVPTSKQLGLCRELLSQQSSGFHTGPDSTVRTANTQRRRKSGGQDSLTQCVLSTQLERHARQLMPS